MVSQASTGRLKHRFRMNLYPKRSHGAISWLPSSLLIVGLVALALFVVGPLAGSIDDDGDGSPDIPVVVIEPGTVNASSPLMGLRQRSGSVDDVVVPAFSETHTRNIEIGKPDSPCGDSRMVLQSSCRLRC
jgi:hypothetical protein